MKSRYKNIASTTKLKHALRVSICCFGLLLALIAAILLAVSVGGAKAHADDPIRFTVSHAGNSSAFVYNRNEFYQPVADTQQNLAESNQENESSDNQNTTKDGTSNAWDNLLNWLSNIFGNKTSGTENADNEEQDAANTNDTDKISTQTATPSRFLLTVDKLTATPVRDQGRVGSCWAFGAIAAAESSLVNDGLATLTVDLAEKHFTWFEHTPISALSTVTGNVSDTITRSTDNATDESAGTDDEAGELGEGADISSCESSRSAKVNSTTISQPLLDNQSLASKVGEGYTITNANGTSAEEPSTNWRIANLGGFASSVYKLFATGQGPALESAYPYNAQASNASSAATTGDWSIPADQRFTQQNYDLTDCNILPSVYVKKKGTSAVGIQAVKNEIARGRCVATGIHVGSSARELGRDSAYTKGGYSYMYTYNEESTNHEVTIVGYDDNMPASTFAMGNGSAANTPPANGAFLVKDSAGSNFALRADGTERTAEEKAANTGGGYYWVSYYDKGLYEQLTCKFQAPTGYKCYAYDIIGNATNVVNEFIRDDEEEEGETSGDGTNSYNADDNTSNNADNNTNSDDADKSNNTDSNNESNNNNVAWGDEISDNTSQAQETSDSDAENDYSGPDTPLYAANIYTASEDLKINEISVESLGDTDTLTIEVRVLDPDEEDNFARITKVEPAITIQEKRFEFGGYHRLKLDQAIPVRQGHKFAVAVSHLLDNGHFAVPYTTTRRQITSDNSSGYITNGCTINCNSVVNPGESVIFYNDVVTDITEATQDLDKNYTYQNFTLNAYTSPATEDEIQQYEDSHNQQDPIASFLNSIASLFGFTP